jgi:hypothetical protein
MSLEWAARDGQTMLLIFTTNPYIKDGIKAKKITVIATGQSQYRPPLFCPLPSFVICH